MRVKFESIEDHNKDKHIRKKLSKCNYTLSKIQRSDNDDVLDRALKMQEWIDSERC